MKNFATVLKEARKRARLTQKELASRTGLDHSYISKIERAASDPPSRDKVLAMAEALGLMEKARLVYFLLAAGCAGLEDFDTSEEVSQEENRPGINFPFADGAYNFPDISKIEESELIERIRQLLNNSAIPLDKRKENKIVLQSFTTWLEYKTNIIYKYE